MSSFIAHAVTAYAITEVARGPQPRLREGLWMLPVLGFAWLPDGDYALRLLGFGDPAVRWSHSFVFVLGAWCAYALIACAVPPLRPVFGRAPMLLACLAAALSHPIMDWLVGSSWGDPLLWPLSTERLSSPVGILPFGSSNMDPARLRTWQNLAMELGLLVPFAWQALSYRRGKLTKSKAIIAVLAAMPFAVWAASLQR